MLTERPSLTHTDDSISRWEKFKKGVLGVETEDGMWPTVCFPNGEGYFKYFMLPDVLSDKMVKMREIISLESDNVIKGRPMHRILLEMGANVRIEGNFHAYMFPYDVARTINPFTLMSERDRRWALRNGGRICLVDERHQVWAYWSEKGFEKANGNIIRVRNVPVWMDEVRRKYDSWN
jgi:hypothetical protein